MYKKTDDKIITPNYLKNREREIERSRKYRQKEGYKEKMREYHKEYYAKNKEKMVLKAQAYYQKNKDKINTYNKRRYHTKIKDKKKEEEPEAIVLNIVF